MTSSIASRVILPFFIFMLSCSGRAEAMATLKFAELLSGWQPLNALGFADIISRNVADFSETQTVLVARILLEKSEKMRETVDNELKDRKSIPDHPPLKKSRDTLIRELCPSATKAIFDGDASVVEDWEIEEYAGLVKVRGPNPDAKAYDMDRLANLIKKSSLEIARRYPLGAGADLARKLYRESDTVRQFASASAYAYGDQVRGKPRH